MKKNSIVIRMSILILVATGIMQTPLFAQKNFEGKITFKLSYENLPEEMEGFASMMASEMTMFLKGAKSRIEQSSIMGNTVTIADMDLFSGFSEMELQGQKLRIVVNSEDLRKEQLRFQEYEYTNETKEIAGYTCKKVLFQDSTENISIYCTDKFDSQKHPLFSSLKGFPLGYVMQEGETKIIVTASEVTPQSLEDALFEKSADYKEVTQEELGQMLIGGQEE